MIVAPDTTALRHHIRGLKDSSRRIAFVPTMGNLHAGHLALVTQAQACADAVVVSIFVNPMQFAAHEDLDKYPRTLDADLAALESIGVDVVFTPTVTDLYPEGVEGLFEIYYAPADTFETVNTLGLPLYARMIPDRDRDEWVRLEIESNPLPICTRPQVLRSAKRT